MNENKYTIKCSNLSKKFVRKPLFRDVSFEISTGRSLAITGSNGSGKSTLLQIVSGIQKGTTGKIEYQSNGTAISRENWIKNFGFTSPLIKPYDELTALENIRFLNNEKTTDEIDSFFKRFDLIEHKHKILKHYSSGMKQRLKIILAIINNPPILFFDEPCSNLDSKGKEKVYSLIDSLKPEKIIIIASNEQDEIDLCHEVINLD